MKKYGIFTAGGGGKGRLQAGILYELAKAGYLNNAALYAGSSVGSLNGALAAVYGDNTSLMDAEVNIDLLPLYEELVQAWARITCNKDVYKGNIDGKFLSNVGAFLGLALGGKSILDPAPLYNMLQGIFKEFTLAQWAAVANKDICFTASDLTAQKEVFFASYNEYKNMKLYDVLRASAAIPAVFPTVALTMPDGPVHYFADGGLGANDPLAALDSYNDYYIDAPIKKAIIIFTSPDTQPVSKKPYDKGLDAALASVTAMLSSQEQIAELFAELMTETGALEVLALYPQTDTGDALDFTPRDLWHQGCIIGAAGVGYDYTSKKIMTITDFLSR